MASGPITSWQIDGETMETVTDLILCVCVGAPKSLLMVTAAMKLKDVCSLEESYDQPSEVAQSCLTLCDPVNCSLSGSSVHGFFQARVLEWLAISFSSGSSRPSNLTRVSRIAGRRFTV